jgi:hypothetical protein
MDDLTHIFASNELVKVRSTLKYATGMEMRRVKREHMAAIQFTLTLDQHVIWHDMSERIVSS